MWSLLRGWVPCKKEGVQAAVTSFTVTVPIPTAKLSHNGRVHWRVRAKLVKAARESAKLDALAALRGQHPPQWDKAKLEVRAFWKTLNMPDPTNLMDRLKSTIDGICDAGIVVDDANLWPERPVITKDAKNPRIELTISPEP